MCTMCVLMRWRYGQQWDWLLSWPPDYGVPKYTQTEKKKQKPKNRSHFARLSSTVIYYISFCGIYINADLCLRYSNYHSVGYYVYDGRMCIDSASTHTWRYFHIIFFFCCFFALLILFFFSSSFVYVYVSLWSRLKSLHVL